MSKLEIYTCKLIQFLSKVGSPNELAFHGEERFFGEILTESPGTHIRPLCEISQETNQFEILSETNSDDTYFLLLTVAIKNPMVSSHDIP